MEKQSRLILYIAVITLFLVLQTSNAKSVKQLGDEIEELLIDVKTLQDENIIKHIEEQLSDEIALELTDMTRDEMVKVAGILKAIHSPDRHEVTSYVHHLNSLTDEELNEHMNKLLMTELDTELHGLDSNQLGYLDGHISGEKRENNEKRFKLSPAALEDVAEALLGQKGKDFVHASGNNENDADHWKDLLHKLKPNNERQGPQKRLISALVGTIVTTAASTLTSNAVNSMWNYWK